jgi:hypothetical protein
VAVLATEDGVGCGASFNSSAVLYTIPRLIPYKKNNKQITCEFLSSILCYSIFFTINFTSGFFVSGKTQQKPN